MTELLPSRLLMRFEVAIHRFEIAPTIDGDLSDWGDRYRLPPLSRVDGRDEWGEVCIGWDDSGLYIACRVEGKTQALRCDPQHFWKGDNLRVMTDMRDTRTIHRASPFCQHWYFLPTGGGRNGQDPVAASAKVKRANQHAPIVPPGRLPVASRIASTGYKLEAHIPAECLAGFDPSDNPRIGVYTMLEDGDHGQQSLTVGDDMPWWVDPSLWATGVLVE